MFIFHTLADGWMLCEMLCVLSFTGAAGGKACNGVLRQTEGGSSELEIPNKEL